MKQVYAIYEVSYFKPLIQHLERIGVATQKLIHQTELRHFELSTTKNYIPATVVYDFFSVLGTTYDLPKHFINLSKSTNSGVTDSILNCAKDHTLKEALKLFLKKLSTDANQPHYSIKTTKSKVICALNTGIYESFGQEKVVQFGLVTCFKLINYYLKNTAQLIEYSCSSESTLTIRYLLATTEYTVCCNYKTNELIFPKELLQYSCPIQEAVLVKKDNPILPNEESLVTIITKVVGSYKSGHIPCLNTLASHFNISESSMKRLLKSQDTKFSDILSTVLYDKAVDLLTTSDMKIINIGEHLGYTESPNFIRFFKKWSGSTPGDFRKNLVVANA